LSQKLEAAQLFASSLPKNDIIMFTDAFDVMFMNSPDYIHSEFRKFQDVGVLFAGECGCWPHIMDEPAACFHKYPRSPTPYRYLNSGTWIGFANSSSEMLRQVMIGAGKDFDNANDQKLCADMYMEGKFGIQLDFYSRIFQSVHMTLDPPLPRCNPKVTFLARDI